MSLLLQQKASYQEVPDEDLTAGQKSAIERAVAWVKDPKGSIFTISGRAGTGKSSIIKKIISAVRPISVSISSFTGKAVSVLRAKGMPYATTIHSLMYHPDGTEGSRLKWKKVDRLPCKLVIIDEFSMVDKSIVEDFLSYGVLIIGVGDHWQLEPLGENPNLMLNPDVVLEQIHRQAEGSNILKFAENVHYNRDSFYKREVPGLMVGGAGDFWSVLKDVDQCLVGYNRTRHLINKMFRDQSDRKTLIPEVGERIIFLKNNKDFGVFNGLTGRITRIRDVTDVCVALDFEDDLGNRWYDLPTFRCQYGIDSLASVIHTEYLLADWAYALTVHKSQGSEWRTGAILEEIAPSWNPAKWRYTAITRFSEAMGYFR